MGGARNVINCRCVLLYIEPEDEIVTTPDEPVRPPVAPVEPTQDREGRATKLRQRQTETEIKVLKASKAKTETQKLIAQNAQDDRYLTIEYAEQKLLDAESRGDREEVRQILRFLRLEGRRFGRRSKKDYGRVVSTSANDQVATATSVIQGELDDIADIWRDRDWETTLP